MEYRKLGSTGLKVSEICFGTATFGWHTDDDESERMLDLFLDRGGNFIDTADVYSVWAEESWAGRSEEMIGTWLTKTGRRHEIVLATKCRSAMGDLPNDQGLSRRHIVDAVEASLNRLNTDFIDLYQTHSMDADTPIEETMRALDDLVRRARFATWAAPTTAPGGSARPCGSATVAGCRATSAANPITVCCRGTTSSERWPTWSKRGAWRSFPTARRRRDSSPASTAAWQEEMLRLNEMTDWREGGTDP